MCVCCNVFLKVVLESVDNIERCLRLKLAPKNPDDFEILVCTAQLSYVPTDSYFVREYIQ